MLAERAEDGAAVGLRRRHVLQVAGREAAAEIDHLRAGCRAPPRRGRRRPRRRARGPRRAGRSAASRHGRRRRRRRGRALRRAPARRRLPPATQPNLRLSGHSAPSPSVRMRQNTRAPGAARATFSTSSTQSTAKRRDAERMRAGDVALLLDGVAVGDALRRGAGRQRHLDLGHGRRVEGRAERGEQRQDLGRRIGLDRIEDAAVGKRAGEGFEIAAHDVEVDDEARARRVVARRGTRGCGQSSSGECPHAKRCSPGSSCAEAARDGDGVASLDPPNRQEPGGSRRTAFGPREQPRSVSHRLDREDPLRTSGKESVCLFSVAGLWRADRDQKSPPPSLL